MNYQIKVTPELRVRLAFAETIEVDLSDASEVRELQASAAESNLHIDTLHAAIKELFAQYHSDINNIGSAQDLKNAISLVRQLVNNWEDDQCL